MNIEGRASGILLHITSLPGPFGIGDFGPEAYAFVDWLQAAGQRLWQWLPTAPVGPGNSPYQSVSAFAGSPLMVALQPLIAKGWLSEPWLPEGGFDAWRVDFDRVAPWRLARLREAYAGFEARASAADRHALAQWRAAAAHWLDDYALFMALETAHGGASWWHWPAVHARRDRVALAAARIAHADEIGFWTFVQWCFDSQCAALKAYANARGIGLVGDLPIFVAHHSADCWARPDLYTLDENFQPTVVAGVPPDPLGPFGQRWGNPLYRWDRMAAEDFAWWTARSARALELSDLFRIDHFRGFAGYWEIPADSEDAMTGRWLPGPGQALFAAIERRLGPLPVIAEDLGLITDDVYALRKALGYPGMAILQFAFGGGADHMYLPHNIQPDCVAYTGTHDNDTVRGWWDATGQRERHYAGTYLACGANDVHWAMIRAAMASPARLAIFPLQDVLGLPSDQRMNVPGTMEHNWGWRCSAQMWQGGDATRVLGLFAAATGRGPFEKLGVGAPPPPAHWPTYEELAAL